MALVIGIIATIEGLAVEGLGRIARPARDVVGGEGDLHGDRRRRAFRHVLRGDQVSEPMLGRHRRTSLPSQRAARSSSASATSRSASASGPSWTGLDLDVYRGEILGFVGASGQGKSVLTRAILGLVPEARRHHRGVRRESRRAVARRSAGPLERRWGVLFQQGALFSALTVKQNVQVPMREYLNLSDRLLDELAMLKIEMVGLKPDAADKVPSELSGGMIKRAALARALALDPEIVFLDEPTSGLDPIGAGEFDELIATLQQTLGLTVFMVTHDLDSLYTVCDRIAALGDGQDPRGRDRSRRCWRRTIRGCGPIFTGSGPAPSWATGPKVDDGNAGELCADRLVHAGGDRGGVRLRLLVLRRRPRPGAPGRPHRLLRLGVRACRKGSMRAVQRPARRRGDGDQPAARGSAPRRRRHPGRRQDARSAPTPARASSIRA